MNVICSWALTALHLLPADRQRVTRAGSKQATAMINAMRTAMTGTLSHPVN
jgi:hypothetical protein